MTFKKISQSLGEDILEGLIKSEVFKPETNTNINLEEVALAYKIVPKAVLTWAIIEFNQMKIGGVKEIPVPFKLGYSITINKHAADVYSGELYHSGSVATRFKMKPLAGIALVVMSALEMYEIPKEETVNEPHLAPLPIKEEHNIFALSNLDIDAKINAIVMEKLLMQNMISCIVERKMEERDAIKRLIALKEKEKEEIKPEVDHSVVESEAEDEFQEENRKESIRKLKEFLNKKSKDKIQPITELNRSITCECGQTVYKNSSKTVDLCICYGEFMNKSLNIITNNNKCTIEFPKDFGLNNTEMLLATLKKGK